jgi:hypothetical protein
MGLTCRTPTWQALVELYYREKAFFWAAHLVPQTPEPAAGTKTGVCV